MKIAIIGGFLGSGKTTSIIELGRYLSENNHKIAILVNEIGEIGLDGDTISGSGIQTKELTSGCICCSLKIDLEITLNSLIEDFSPDIVLIEPTGIAFPGQIKEDISSMDCSTNFSFAPIICLVDGNRFSTEFSQIPKFVVTQLEESEVIGINKIDVTPIDKIQETIERIADINSTAKIIPFTARKNDDKFKLVFNNIFEESDQRKELESLNSIEMSKISTFSVNLALDDFSMNESDCKELLGEILISVKEKVVSVSPYFIGHIKAVISLPGSIIKVSLTSFEEEPEISIFESNEDKSQNLKILVAVTGIKPEELKNLAEDTIHKTLNYNSIGFHQVESHLDRSNFTPKSEFK